MIELIKDRYYQFFGNGNTYQFKRIEKKKYIFEDYDFLNWNPLLDNEIAFKEFDIQFLIECEKPKVGYIETVYKYSEYSEYSKRLAVSYTTIELQKIVKSCINSNVSLQKSNFNAIKKTSSMQSNSQHRAMSEIALNFNISNKDFYIDAIKIRFYYPNKCIPTI